MRFMFCRFGTACSRFIVTGKVYEGVTRSLTVQKHSIEGCEEGCLGHKPRGVEGGSRKWRLVRGVMPGGGYA